MLSASVSSPKTRISSRKRVKSNPETPEHDKAGLCKERIDEVITILEDEVDGSRLEKQRGITDPKRKYGSSRRQQRHKISVETTVLDISSPLRPKSDPEIEIGNGSARKSKRNSEKQNRRGTKSSKSGTMKGAESTSSPSVLFSPLTAKSPPKRPQSPKASPPPLRPPPDELLCPITLCVMTDPVLAMDGHTYERAAIEDWLRRSRDSPRTGAPLTSDMLLPNHALRALISALALSDGGLG